MNSMPYYTIKCNIMILRSNIKVSNKACQMGCLLLCDDTIKEYILET